MNQPANPAPRPLLIFDMDGVLVDVSESYRETIARTVECFTGRAIGPGSIQEYKNEGAWNDDWLLTHHIIRMAGVDAGFEDVKARFQSLFLGEGGNPGLMLRERWLACPGSLEALHDRFDFAIFTGRPRDEVQLTLDRFAPNLVFDPIVAMYDVANPKPVPDGLLKILAAHPTPEAFYIGDTVGDARSARAAGMPFIGIAAPSNPLHVDLVELLQAEGACAILADINLLPQFLAHREAGQ